MVKRCAKGRTTDAGHRRMRRDVHRHDLLGAGAPAMTDVAAIVAKAEQWREAHMGSEQYADDCHFSPSGYAIWNPAANGLCAHCTCRAVPKSYASHLAIRTAMMEEDRG